LLAEYGDCDCGSTVVVGGLFSSWFVNMGCECPTDNSE
jgi:hypothetical protein